MIDLFICTELLEMFMYLFPGARMQRFFSVVYLVMKMLKTLLLRE